MGDEGIERPPLSLSKHAIPEDVRTKSGTVDGEKAPSDPDLAKIVAAWPRLPDAVRSAIPVIVNNAIGH
jgi:hypothetical protein